MSCTVRTYTDSELKTIKSGKPCLLTTIFMNGKTFEEREIRCYPYLYRKTYLITFFGSEPIEVYATDDESLMEFLKLEYNLTTLLEVAEKKTTYRFLPIKPYIPAGDTSY